MKQQLPLPVNLPDDETLDSFQAGDNKQLLAHLGALDSPNTPFITFIVGESGSGKSHLLHGLCHRITAEGKQGFYLGLQDLSALAPAMLEGLEASHLICIDDLQYIEGHGEWQRALFDLINRVRETGISRMVITADRGPKQLTLSLADLASRLSWGVTFALAPLQDDDKIKALTDRAHRRGLSMNPDVARFLLAHCQRSMTALMGVLEQLDQASLQEKRRLTVPFVKSALGI